MANIHIPPTIDLSGTWTDPAARKAVAAQIRKVASEEGYFYVTGHQVPDTAVNGILSQIKHFFEDQPQEVKNTLRGKFGFGYESVGYTSAEGDRETKEAFNFGYEEAIDASADNRPVVKKEDGTVAQFVKNAWPEEKDLPGFFEAMRSYYSGVFDLTMHLVKLYALSLDLPEDAFEHLTTRRQLSGRLMYYPPAKNPKPLDPNERANEVGMGAHSDYQVITVNNTSTGGLEVLTNEGRWVSVPNKEGALIVNGGDFLSRCTNDLYKSPVHRVCNRSGTECRTSIPIFFTFNYDDEIGVFPHMCSEKNPARYPPVSTAEYIVERVKFTTKAEAEKAILLRRNQKLSEEWEKVRSPISDDPERARLFDESQKRKLAAIGLIVAN
ncbi:hypothetical protein BC567DRAFT_249816 [Phyllosticta citribraziliensis]